MAGVLAVTTLTTSLGAFSVMVEDKVDKIYKGFYASPVKRSHITAAYILSPFFVSMIMATIVAVGFSFYLLINGVEIPGLIGILQLIGVLLLSSISATAMVCFIVSFVNTNSVYGTVTAIIGTLSGFLMGIYIPIGVLPNFVQTIIKLFPPSHATSLLRRILMERPLEIAFEGVPAHVFDAQALKETLGVIYKFGDFEITPIISVLYLTFIAILFFGLSAINMRKKA
jgi:multidrug/hemolysin transport system permease protein